MYEQKIKPPAFHIVPLGVKGVIDESNLSAYPVAPINTNNYLCLDAGTVTAGIEKAVASGAFTEGADIVLKKYIKGYFITHAHLDHVSGFIITSPNDSSKTVYALPTCMTMLEDYYFNGNTWANFGDEGKGFLLKKYHFKRLAAGEETTIDNTTMKVTALPLNHVKPFESAAFLIRHNEQYVLYLGDTAEYCVGGDINELPLKNLQIIPSNFDHSKKIGEFAKLVFQHKNKLQLRERNLIPNDTKLFATANIEKSVEFYLLSDTESYKIYKLLKEDVSPKFQFIDLNIPFGETFGILNL